jgi:hypothetical protein
LALLAIDEIIDVAAAASSSPTSERMKAGAGDGLVERGGAGLK